MAFEGWQRRRLVTIVVVVVAAGAFVSGFASGRVTSHSSRTLVTVPAISQPASEFVPDLAMATNALRGSGLRIGSICRVSNEVEGGFLGQFPTAGSQVPKGTAIDLLVSNGLRLMDPPGCYDQWKPRGYA